MMQQAIHVNPKILFQIHMKNSWKFRFAQTYKLLLLRFTIFFLRHSFLSWIVIADRGLLTAL